MRVNRADWIPVSVKLSGGILQDAEPTDQSTNYHVQRLWLNEEFTICSDSGDEIVTIKPQYVEFRTLFLQVIPHVICHIRDSSEEFTLDEAQNYNEYKVPIKIYAASKIVEIDSPFKEDDKYFDLIIQGEDIKPRARNNSVEEI